MQHATTYIQKQADMNWSEGKRENKHKKKEKRMTRTTPPVGTPVLIGPVSQSLVRQTFKVMSSSFPAVVYGPTSQDVLVSRCVDPVGEGDLS